MADELILIVEDNEKSLKLARDLLQFKGYRTLEATTAAIGIELAVIHMPQLVLMDIQLPDMDGITALHQLRAKPTMSKVPIVALTAFAMKGDRERFLGVGFDGYLIKPINIKEFPEQVRQFCQIGTRIDS